MLWFTLALFVLVVALSGVAYWQHLRLNKCEVAYGYLGSVVARTPDGKPVTRAIVFDALIKQALTAPVSPGE